MKQFETNQLKMFYEPSVENTLLQKLLLNNNTKEFKY